MKGSKPRRNWGMIILMVVIMIGTSFSFLLFGFSGTNDVVREGGIKFVKFPDRWEALVNGRHAAFTFLPSEVRGIKSDDISGILAGKLEIDVTSDVNSTLLQEVALAEHQMGLTLQGYNIFIRKGFAGNNTFGMPIIRCTDATSAVPVVYMFQGNETKIISNESCVLAEASSAQDMMRVKDRLVYGILGVIK